MRTLTTAKRLGLLAVVAAAFNPATASAARMPSFKSGRDVHVQSAKRLSPRLFAVTLTTPLLTAPTNVRILLPTDYDRHPARRYPVLYLFHGTSGGAGDWTAQPGRAQDTTAKLPLIVVMPDAGVNSNGGGWFTNWVNGGKLGPPKWESWHMDRVIPWIDHTLRTRAQRDGRAIAGLSQGGFGAMSYAARHPDTFGVAASFSGAVDISANGAIADPLVTPVINATEVGLDGVPPNTFFGDRATDEINWAAHDPATLAGNLRGMRLYAWTGNGSRGPLDDNSTYNPGSAAIEAGVHELSQLFHGELVKRSIPISYHDYGPGTHSWPYWERDLRELVGPLMRDFAAHLRAPARIDFTCDRPRWSEWGWTVAITRPSREFSTLARAGRTGFALTGSGKAVVTTPARYRRGAVASVRVRPQQGPAATRRVRVDRGGRLHITVPLGPGNQQQEDLPGVNTARFTTTVTISSPR
jgi:S-formylglutathione hydrolase FrmB